jgi:hypothetical protein
MFISMYVCIYKRLFKICQSKMVHSYLKQLLNKEKLKKREKILNETLT